MTIPTTAGFVFLTYTVLQSGALSQSAQLRELARASTGNFIEIPAAAIYEYSSDALVPLALSATGTLCMPLVACISPLNRPPWASFVMAALLLVVSWVLPVWALVAPSRPWKTDDGRDRDSKPRLRESLRFRMAAAVALASLGASIGAAQFAGWLAPLKAGPALVWWTPSLLLVLLATALACVWDTVQPSTQESSSEPVRAPRTTGAVSFTPAGELAFLRMLVLAVGPAAILLVLADARPQPAAQGASLAIALAMAVVAVALDLRLFSPNGLAWTIAPNAREQLRQKTVNNQDVEQKLDEISSDLKTLRERLQTDSASRRVERMETWLQKIAEDWQDLAIAENETSRRAFWDNFLASAEKRAIRARALEDAILEAHRFSKQLSAIQRDVGDMLRVTDA